MDDDLQVQTDQLLDTFAPEELHDELKPYVDELRSQFPVLRHPLVYCVPYAPFHNKLINAQYRHKRAEIDRILALDDSEFRDLARYVYLHEKPYQFLAFADIHRKLTDADYWRLLGEVWTGTENFWQNILLVKSFLNSERSERHRIMGADGQALFDALPDEFVVYRGHQGVNRLGYSWTLSYGRARWFAHRWNRPRSGVVRGLVRKEDVIAVFTNRGEFEVAVCPDDVTYITTVRRLSRPSPLAEIHRRAAAQFRLNQHRTDHGPWHWEKVEKNGLELCRRILKADRAVVRLFAVLHDSQRANEMDDPEHGERAAAYARSLGKERLGISPLQLEILCEACEFHEKGMVSPDPTIGVCWDADRLDLNRVGIVTDPKYISTHAAKGLIWKI